MIVWIDIETTGLRASECVMLELALVITDDDLNVLNTFQRVIGASQADIDRAPSVVYDMHMKSGLLGECLHPGAPSFLDVEIEALEWLRACEVPEGELPLAGSSLILDRSFLDEWMPKLHSYFHYRSIDVSSVKELTKRWFPTLAYPSTPEEDKAHRGAVDVLESIKELAYYRDRVFVPSVSGFNT